MTDWQRHANFVFNHPNNKVAALALVDHDQEGGSITRRQALREVAHLRVTSRRAKRCAKAARIMSRKDACRRFIERQVIYFSAGSNAPTVVLIGTGWMRPTYVGDGVSYSKGPVLKAWYQVGAGWVLNAAMLYKTLGAKNAHAHLLFESRRTLK